MYKTERSEYEKTLQNVYTKLLGNLIEVLDFENKVRAYYYQIKEKKPRKIYTKNK